MLPSSSDCRLVDVSSAEIGVVRIAPVIIRLILDHVSLFSVGFCSCAAGGHALLYHRVSHLL